MNNIPKYKLHLNTETFADTLPQGFVFQDSEGKIQFANASALRILGVTLEEIQGRDSYDTNWMAIQEDGYPFPGEEHPASVALKTGKEIKNKIMGVFNSAAQKYIWISIHAIPVFTGEKSEPSGVYITFDDITEFKKNKDFETELYTRLRQSSLEIAQRQNAIDKHAIVAITDKNGTIVYVNQRFCKISKYSKEELIGKNHRIINSGYHSKFFFQNMYSTIQSGDTWHGEIRNRAKDKSYYWVATTIAPLKNVNGEIEQYLAIRTDITERVNAEEALRVSEARTRAILDNSLESILFLNPNKNIEFYNNVAANNAKVIFDTELRVGESILSVISSEEKELFEKSFQCALQGERIVMEKLFLIHNTKLWFEIQYAPIKNTTNQIIGVLVNARDINEKKRADEARNKYMIELENLIQTKDKFFNIIAHDLRNPFAGIIGISEMLEEKLKSEKSENSNDILKISQLIQSSSKSAFSLLENLMQWARSQTGDLRFEPIITSINAIIEATLVLVEGNAFKKNITIERKLDTEKFIYADPEITKTILRNILTNAIKFTFPSGKIIISNKFTSNFVEVSISDTGMGMQPKNLDKLFRIDSKFSNLGTESEKGTGLGLILCKEFAEKQGGKIWVESELGKGSTFTFTLPLAGYINEPKQRLY